jgi:hypothetical protein
MTGFVPPGQRVAEAWVTVFVVVPEPGWNISAQQYAPATRDGIVSVRFEPEVSPRMFPPRASVWVVVTVAELTASGLLTEPWNP